MFNKTLKLLMAILSVILIALVLAAVSKASETQLWMVLRPGAAGLDFYCTDQSPYQTTAVQVDWMDYAAHPEDLDVWGSAIEVEYCNLDVIYNNNRAPERFVWRFTERVTNVNHLEYRHMTRGVFYINLLSFEEFGN